jgi:hypothetical protein
MDGPCKVVRRLQSRSAIEVYDRKAPKKQIRDSRVVDQPAGTRRLSGQIIEHQLEHLPMPNRRETNPHLIPVRSNFLDWMQIRIPVRSGHAVTRSDLNH